MHEWMSEWTLIRTPTPTRHSLLLTFRWFSRTWHNTPKFFLETSRQASTIRRRERPDHSTGNSVSYSLRIVCGLFDIPYQLSANKGCETGAPAYGPYPRRNESLTICWWNYNWRQHFLLSYLKTQSISPVRRSKNNDILSAAVGSINNILTIKLVLPHYSRWPSHVSPWDSTIYFIFHISNTMVFEKSADRMKLKRWESIYNHVPTFFSI